MEFITACIIALLLVREAMTFIERKDMLDRLMAKSLPEYKDNTSTEENHLDDSDGDDSVPIEDAEEDLMGEEALPNGQRR